MGDLCILMPVYLYRNVQKVKVYKYEIICFYSHEIEVDGENGNV